MQEAHREAQARNSASSSQGATITMDTNELPPTQKGPYEEMQNCRIWASNILNWHWWLTQCFLEIYATNNSYYQIWPEIVANNPTFQAPQVDTCTGLNYKCKTLSAGRVNLIPNTVFYS